MEAGLEELLGKEQPERPEDHPEWIKIQKPKKRKVPKARMNRQGPEPQKRIFSVGSCLYALVGESSYSKFLTILWDQAHIFGRKPWGKKAILSLEKQTVLSNPSNCEVKRLCPAILPSTHGTVCYLLKCLLVHSGGNVVPPRPLPLKSRVAKHTLFLH